MDKRNEIKAVMKQGFAVFPVVGRTHQPAIIAWQARATTNLKNALKYFEEHPEQSYGVLCGGEFFVVDVDGPEGEESLRRLEKIHGPLPATWIVKTKRGWHYYFRKPPGFRVRNFVGRFAKGIDLRGEGGFVIGPGSTHATGHVYRFMPGRGPGEVEIADAPAWVLERIRKISPLREMAPVSTTAITLANWKRAEAYAKAAYERELDRLRKAPMHQRNNTLNLCAFQLGQLAAHGLLDLKAIKADLARIAHQIGLEPDEIPGTVRSGLAAGLKCPRNLGFLSGGKPEREIEPPPLVDGLAEKLALLNGTDTDNATRFARRWGNRVLFTTGHGWMVFDGKRWRVDSQLRCMELAKKTARLIAKEPRYIESDADKQKRAQFAKLSLSKASLDRMLDLAKSLLIVEDTRLDSDPWLLNTLTGTIDLKTGLLLPHDSRDLLTKIAPVHADMNAKCPRFQAFLSTIMAGDRPMIEYVSRASGYTLTGLTSEQTWFFGHGREGANGKSTLLNLIRDMLGDYGVHTPTETFLVKAFDNNIPADLARLAGARMVTAIEANYNRPLDEARIKAITGGEPITARFMRQNFFQFQPQLKLWIGSNDVPHVRATADAFWRRVHVIPFPVTLPPDQRDRDLPTKLQQEWPGILAWAVRGCLEWQRIGLAPPPGVAKAAEVWREGVDTVKRFINECLVFEASSVVTTSGMYQSFKKWCDHHGEQPAPIQKFKARMQELDITYGRIPGKGTRIWKGVKLRH
jgi:putative DNA primase/helicase